jgi:hypothetical protein
LLINVAVSIAVTIKIIVAVIDRDERRDIPQMPCPLVQPFPKLVPTPTKKPPIISIGIDLVIKNGISFFEIKEKIIGPKTKPKRNNKLSNLLLAESIKFLIIPLIPANRPLPIKNNITAKPIIIPPIKAGSGVKFTMFMLISLIV